MTETIRNPEALELYTIATEDESVLQYPLPDRVFGFHAQQSCEKLLKCLLSGHGNRFPFTHLLVLLVDKLRIECSEHIPPLPFDLGELEPFAVQFRYGAPIELTEQDRLAIRETVSTLRAFTLRRILELQQA